MIQSQRIALSYAALIKYWILRMVHNAPNPIRKPPSPLSFHATPMPRGLINIRGRQAWTDALDQPLAGSAEPGMSPPNTERGGVAR